MSITLSWDLFAIVFGALVVTYSLIMGKRESMKIVLASYVAIVAVQGFGNLLERLLEKLTILQFIGIGPDPFLIAAAKLIIFVIIVIGLAVKAGLTLTYEREPNPAVNMGITALCGVATAGLLLSTLLTYISTLPLLDPKTPGSATLSNLIAQSTVMNVLITNQDVFFLLPAVVLLVAGFASNK